MNLLAVFPLSTTWITYSITQINPAALGTAIKERIRSPAELRGNSLVLLEVVPIVVQWEVQWREVMAALPAPLFSRKLHNSENSG